LGLYKMWSFTLAHGTYNGNREQQFLTNVFPVSWQWECAAPCDCSPTQLAYFSELTPEAQRFRENIRQYNAVLAFTSLGVKVDSAINAGGGGPPTFRIHGKLSPTWLSTFTGVERPVNAQLYIYDPRSALEHRMYRNPGLDPNVMQRLQYIILTHHRWATTFKQVSNVFQQPRCQDVSIQSYCQSKPRSTRFNPQHLMKLQLLCQETGLSHIANRILFSTSKMVHFGGSATVLQCTNVSSTRYSSFTGKMVIT
jgi:hypothetical protein